MGWPTKCNPVGNMPSLATYGHHTTRQSDPMGPDVGPPQHIQEPSMSCEFVLKKKIKI
ncbi:hypothetical protein KFK09_027031 [Dendrobium nobile]|uniref:Uncharacterized protein n=1 Tax=Dendrobium nobile TaxID=94219 RepID=A0A8T3AEN7_DENNO|nr:hypothetical protein KFK09_027031 [Dendrobium nobile]